VIRHRRGRGARAIGKRVGVCAAGIAAVLALAASPSPAPAASRCGRVVVAAYRQSAKVRIAAGKASCAQARTLIRDAFTAFVTRPRSGRNPVYGAYWNVRGWRCLKIRGGTQAVCMQKHKQIHGSFRSDDDWRF
jgi:hypothetical protein